MPLSLIPWPSSAAELDSLPRPAGTGTREEALGRVIADAMHVARALGGAGDPDGFGPEGYYLRADESGVVIASATKAGAFYAERTLAQLLTETDDGWVVPAVEIRDEPRFAHRGVMLDVARSFHPVPTVEGLIDRAASLKLNALHLHLTDDQGWRLELASHPELARDGSGSQVGGAGGGRYSRDDYRRIVEYAAARHITVIPEIDVPGHTHALSLSHPELSAEPVLSEHVMEVVRDHGGGAPTRGEPYTGLAVGFSSLRADAEGLDAFLEEVFGELAALTPGPYLHFGGDEALGTSDADYADLVGRVSCIVAATGKTPIAWHEAGAADTEPGTIGQFWGLLDPDPDHVRRILALVERGGRVILSPADAVYLDMKYDESTRAGLVWANGPTSVRRSYEWEPADVVPGLPDEAIAGVEACLWTETIPDAATLDEMAFPRIGAAAEAAWSRPLGSPQRDWESFRRRTAALAPAWSDAGIGFFASPEIGEPKP